MAEAALVLVSFGVADREARALGLEKLAAEMKEKLPEMEVRQAYTSVFIRKKLLEEGVKIPSLPECLEERRPC